MGESSEVERQLRSDLQQSLSTCDGLVAELRKSRAECAALAELHDGVAQSAAELRSANQELRAELADRDDLVAQLRSELNADRAARWQLITDLEEGIGLGSSLLTRLSE